MTVDPTSPEYVWRQCAAILRDRIENGTYATRLPGEYALANELGVARQTIRKAIALLRDEGLVVVVPAKGVFVKR